MGESDALKRNSEDLIEVVKLEWNGVWIIANRWNYNPYIIIANYIRPRCPQVERPPSRMCVCLTVLNSPGFPLPNATLCLQA